MTTSPVTPQEMDALLAGMTREAVIEKMARVIGRGSPLAEARSAYNVIAPLLTALTDRVKSAEAMRDKAADEFNRVSHERNEMLVGKLKAQHELDNFRIVSDAADEANIAATTALICERDSVEQQLAAMTARAEKAERERDEAQNEGARWEAAANHVLSDCSKIAAQRDTVEQQLAAERASHAADVAAMRATISKAEAALELAYGAAENMNVDYVKTIEMAQTQCCKALEALPSPPTGEQK